MNSLKVLRRYEKVLGYLGGGLAGLGTLGYVGGRMTADIRFVGLVLNSTYVVLIGLVLMALAILGYSARAPRPVIWQLVAGIGTAWGILLVLFPYNRLVVVPGAVFAVFGIALILFGRRDLTKPKHRNDPIPNQK